jgi:predicted RNase H-like nuclease (RuvC/YqgF family)
MRSLGKLLYIAGLVLFLATLGFAQSLGDVAREQRQKQQEKKAQTPPKVITNEDLPEHSPDDLASNQPSTDNTASRPMGSKSADQWKSEIEAQKKSVENLQSQMDKLNASIHFAPGNCVRNCVQWNEKQVQKQDEVQRMQSDLDQQKKKLEDMQDAARKEGYGNAVYEPQQ